MEKNITETVKKNLCVSCEACKVICPQNAIKIVSKKGKFVPVINLNKCNHCGLCYKVCPGVNLDKNLANKKLNVYKIAGHCIKPYVANFKDDNVRKRGASGGVITGLLIKMIENKDIKGAFVLKSEGVNGKIARIELVKSKEEIIKSASSKYIPASVYNVLTKIKKNPKGKYAIVGTSCQFLAIKKYLKLNGIKGKNIIFLGLFCDRTLNYNILEYLKDIIEGKEKIKSINFRSKKRFGWPGNIEVQYENGNSEIINRMKRIEVKDYFQLKRCLLCLDKLNKEADISFGDYYLKDGEEDGRGRTNFIIRTEKGKKIFDKYKKYLDYRKISFEDIIDSQRIEEKLDNKDYIRLAFFGSKNVKKTKISAFKSRIKKIKAGEDYNYQKIRNLIFLKKLSVKIIFLKKAFLFTKTLIFRFLIDFFNLGRKGSRKKDGFNKVVIVGGGMQNKGAQAMTFTVMDKLRKENPSCKIYLFSSQDYENKTKIESIYKLKICKWEIIDKINSFRENKIIESADFFIDISGYAISSQWGFLSSLNYILNIMVAKKYLVDYFIYPQSIGPFDYKFWQKLILFPLFNLYFKYPKKIYSREEGGKNVLEKFTKKNIEQSLDIVLTYDHPYNLDNIYRKKPKFKEYSIPENSIGVIPNQKVMVHMKKGKEDLLGFYKKIIIRSLNKGKKVYILRHSKEDLNFCREIKDLFSDNEKVLIIEDDLNAIELEEVMKKFDFVIVSRYHGLVHAYKNKVPAFVIGWALKYRELMNEFDQSHYFIDGTRELNSEKFIKMVGNLIKKYNYEKRHIKELKNKRL